MTGIIYRAELKKAPALFVYANKHLKDISYTYPRCAGANILGAWKCAFLCLLAFAKVLIYFQNGKDSR